MLSEPLWFKIIVFMHFLNEHFNDSIFIEQKLFYQNKQKIV